MNSRQRTRRGQCLIEVMIGSMFLVPIALFGLDITTLVLCESINDHLAKDAARAAANYQASSRAKAATTESIDGFKTSAIIQKAELDAFDYQSSKHVSVRTKMKVKLPVPFPFFEGTELFAQSTEAIVSEPAAL